MRFGKISLAAVTAVALMSAPVVAQAKTPVAHSTTVTKVTRAGAVRTEENQFGGKSSGMLLGLLALVGIVGGIVIAAGNKADKATSP